MKGIFNLFLILFVVTCVLYSCSKDVRKKCPSGPTECLSIGIEYCVKNFVNRFEKNIK